MALVVERQPRLERVQDEPEAKNARFSSNLSATVYLNDWFLILILQVLFYHILIYSSVQFKKELSSIPEHQTGIQISRNYIQARGWFVFHSAALHLLIDWNWWLWFHRCQRNCSISQYRHRLRFGSSDSGAVCLAWLLEGKPAWLLKNHSCQTSVGALLQSIHFAVNYFKEHTLLCKYYHL